MQMKEKEIYSQLYKIVEQNMNVSGKNMEFSEPIFWYFVGEKKNVADILHLWDSDRQTFLTNMYLQLLRRFPESYAYERWSQDQRDDIAVKKAIVHTLVSSEEFRIKQGLIKNNIVIMKSEQKHKDKRIHLKKRMINYLKPIAKRLPNIIKIRIKKYLKMV